jgi:hypothetical protein
MNPLSFVRSDSFVRLTLGRQLTRADVAMHHHRRDALSAPQQRDVGQGAQRAADHPGAAPQLDRAAAGLVRVEDRLIDRRCARGRVGIGVRHGPDAAVAGAGQRQRARCDIHHAPIR